MLKFGGAAILMQQNFDSVMRDKVAYLVGNSDLVATMPELMALKPFCNEVIEFLDDLSKSLMEKKESRLYSDVITFAFWIRKASVMKLKEQYQKDDGQLYLGRGIAFHIAPSNVPVNFAYSFAAGLLTGNANIVRIPSKDFPQVELICSVINNVLKKHKFIAPYIVLVRYGRDKEINDMLSSIADTRIIWGGDATIAEIRQSTLPPRGVDITFADRYSLAFIDADAYLAINDKSQVAVGFYNDTYLSDQNACTSPRIVVWTGKEKAKAKQLFWEELHHLVEKKYKFQPIQAVNKLTSAYLAAVNLPDCKILEHRDNLIVRVLVSELTGELMDYKDNSGYFFEYDCDNIEKMRPLCNNKHCQTIAYIGNAEELLKLAESGIKGIDRIVPIGKTMDFDLIWDGYNLTEQLTRIVKLYQ